MYGENILQENRYVVKKQFQLLFLWRFNGLVVRIFMAGAEVPCAQESCSS